MYFLVTCFLLVFGVYCFLLPFTACGRTFPMWIRIALWIMALSFIGGNLLGIALASVAPRVAPHIYQALYLNKILIFGMGLGVGLLLIASGEIFRAFLRSKEARNEKRSGG
jgi:TRAP-type uncharacterized transport system fused permease subunit